MVTRDFLPTMPAANTSYQLPPHQAFKVMAPLKYSVPYMECPRARLHEGAFQGLCVCLQVPKKACT